MRAFKATHGSERTISGRNLEFFDLTLNDGNTFAYDPADPCAKSDQRKIDPSHSCATVGITSRAGEARLHRPAVETIKEPLLKRPATWLQQSGTSFRQSGTPSSTSPIEASGSSISLHGLSCAMLSGGSVVRSWSASEGRRTLWDGRGRSACVIFGSCWTRADVSLPAKVRPADGVARIVLGAPSGQAAVAEASRREKVCEQPIGRCKAGVTEAGKTAPATGRIPARAPVAPSARPKLKTLPARTTRLRIRFRFGSERAAELQCRKNGGSARPFQRPRGNPDRRGNAGLEGSANCLTFPKRTWRRRQARARDRRLVKGPGTP